MPTYDLDFIRDAQHRAASMRLEGYELLCALTPESVQDICNGIGPEWMGELARKALDIRFGIARIPAMIHDIRYHFGRGTKADFTAANDELERNTRRMVDDLHPWWSLLRYLGRRDARKLRLACQVGGWNAYMAAMREKCGRCCAAEVRG